MFGRGRGRGRGPSGPKPVARDDDGNIVQTQGTEGPPPLYPPLDRPRVKDKDKDADGGDQDADAKDTYETRLPKLPSSQVLKETEPLVKSLAAMNSWFKKSPYNLGAPGDKKRQAAAMEQLASIITLDPNYFPKELWPDGQRRRGGAKGAQAANWGGPSKRHAGGDAFEFDLGRLEELARRESTQPGAAAGDAGDRIAPGNGALGLLGEEGEDVDDNELGEEEAADDDELYAGDDNPYDQYDDDEGYDDPDDDGGEDPYF